MELTGARREGGNVRRRSRAGAAAKKVRWGEVGGEGGREREREEIRRGTAKAKDALLWWRGTLVGSSTSAAAPSLAPTYSPRERH